MKDGGRKTKVYINQVTTSKDNSPKDDCDLNFSVPLSDVRVALDQVATESFLTIRVEGDSIFAINQYGEICGSIKGIYEEKLLACISNGNNYRAKLLHMRPNVTVQRVR